MVLLQMIASDVITHWLGNFHTMWSKSGSICSLLDTCLMLLGPVASLDSAFAPKGRKTTL